MENRKMIYVFGCLFSIAFALLYYALFHVILQEETASLTLFYNQVGLYKSEENAKTALETIKNQELDAYIFKQDDVHVVICGLSTSEEETKDVGKQLSENNLTYIEKTLQTQNEKCIEAIHAKDFTTALELITNESKTNEQAGAPS